MHTITCMRWHTYDYATRILWDFSRWSVDEDQHMIFRANANGNAFRDIVIGHIPVAICGRVAALGTHRDRPGAVPRDVAAGDKCASVHFPWRPLRQRGWSFDSSATRAPVMEFCREILRCGADHWAACGRDTAPGGLSSAERLWQTDDTFESWYQKSC